MKQYLLAVQFDFEAPLPPDDEVQAMYRDTDRLGKEMQEAGVWVFGGGLVAPTSATVVQVKDGATTMTDGPYAETKETIGGFWIIRATDLDAALGWAEKATRACRAPIEVRPFEDDPTV